MNKNKFLPSLILAAMAVILSSSAVMAQSAPDESQYYREGFFVGIELGVGVGELKFEKDGDKHVSDIETGALSGFRAGYAISRSFVIDAGLYGYSIYGGDPELQLAAALVTGTFYPLSDQGFFIKASAGRGRVDANIQIDGNSLEFSELEGNTLGLGFGVEYPAYGKFLLGGNFDYRLTYLDDQDDLTDLTVRSSGLTIQGKR